MPYKFNQSPFKILRHSWKLFVYEFFVSRSLADGRQKLWDTRLKLLTGIGVIVGAFWAVHTYNSTAERELRRALWEKQVALYFEATEVTSTIASLLPDDPERVKAEKRFWQLYFGALRVIEDDKTVGNQMEEFGQCLTVPGDAAPQRKCDLSDLQYLSLQLGVSCRKSIAENWSRKLEGLKNNL